jgi:Spy/CpxP family protein refolding chaperone
MKSRILALAVMMGLATGLMAQQNEKKDEKQNRGNNPEMRMHKQQGQPDALNLTDAQKESFKQSRLALEKQLQPIRNELGEAEARQRTLTTTDKPDMDAINKNIDKIGALKAQMAKLQVKHHLEMRAQLTDEQRLKFDMFRHQQREGRGPEGMKRRGNY